MYDIITFHFFRNINSVYFEKNIYVYQKDFSMNFIRKSGIKKIWHQILFSKNSDIFFNYWIKFFYLHKVQVFDAFKKPSEYKNEYSSKYP